MNPPEGRGIIVAGIVCDPHKRDVRIPMYSCTYPAGTPEIAWHTPLIKPSWVSIYVFLESGEIPVITPERWVLKGITRIISLNTLSEPRFPEKSGTSP
jgi:hypothetical protein